MSADMVYCALSSATNQTKEKEAEGPAAGPGERDTPLKAVLIYTLEAQPRKPGTGR